VSVNLYSGLLFTISIFFCVQYAYYYILVISWTTATLRIRLLLIEFCIYNDSSGTLPRSSCGHSNCRLGNCLRKNARGLRRLAIRLICGWLIYLLELSPHLFFRRTIMLIKWVLKLLYDLCSLVLRHIREVFLLLHHDCSSRILVRRALTVLLIIVFLLFTVILIAFILIPNALIAILPVSYNLIIIVGTLCTPKVIIRCLLMWH